jgi:two-component system LytT family response regulator
VTARASSQTRLTALVVDDEPLSRRALRQLLARHADVEVLGECADGVEAREALARCTPDVVFLDVQMPGLSGLDVARERGDRATPLIVFVTAFDHFAVPAFETEAVDYVTKPVAEERFDSALARVRSRLRLIEAARRESIVEPTLERLTVRVGERELLVPIDQIDLIEADDVYAAVHAGGRRHLVRMSLDALESRLDGRRFLRVHRSYIVPIDRVRAVRRPAGRPRMLVLASGALVPVSRRRWSSVDESLRGDHSRQEPRRSRQSA